VTKAIYIQPDDHGGYEVVGHGYFKHLENDRTALVIVGKYQDSKHLGLTPDELQALRDRIDDVLRGRR
jgi:hypothetical protein